MTLPTTPIRGFLLDSARTLERPEHYLAAFDFLAERGVNHIIWHFCDDQGCRLAYRSVPGVGSEQALTVSETQALVRAARSRGITLVPEIASLGHSRFITRLPQYRHLDDSGPEYSGMCPVHPQTREVIATLIRETMEIFDAPQMHVGLDEVEIGRNPMTREALRTRTAAQLTADHIAFVRQLVVVEGGRQMWMWGDGLLASPELLSLTPRDIVVCNWQYTAKVDPASTQRLLDAGFDVITASALLSHDQTLFPSSGHALSNVRAVHGHHNLEAGDRQVLGEIVTTWFPCRSLTGAQWLGWHLATGIVNETPAASDLDGAIEAFGRDFHGLPVAPGWTRACRTLVDRAPRRAEWLAVLKLLPTGLPARPTLTAAAEAWRSAVTDLQAIRHQVRLHEPEYEALQLLLELLAHAYETALLATGVPADPMQMATLIGDRETLLARLEDAWDTERFPEDPARFRSVVEAFRDDHLLISVRDGLKSLRERALQIPRTATPSRIRTVAGV